MDFQERDSGLLVPAENPTPPPPRAYGKYEIKDEERRELAKDGLTRPRL